MPALLPDEVKQTLARVAPEAWPSLRSNCSTALDYLRGTHKSDVEAKLRQWFEETMAREELVADVTNFTKQLIERAAALWDTEVDRTYFLNGAELDADSQTVELYNRQEQPRRLGLQDLDRRSYLCKTALLKVEWSRRKNRLKYRVLTPDDVWVVPSEDPASDPDEVQDLDAIIYRLGLVNNKTRWCYWSHDYAFVYEAENPADPGLILADDDGLANPLRDGILPFVVAREDDPNGKFFAAYSDDIVGVSLQLNIAETLQTGNVWYQSHAPLIVPEGTEQKQAWGRGTAYQEPTQDGAGQTRFLTKQTPFDELGSHIQRKIRTLALTNSLPPDDFDFDGAAPESGFAKLVSSMPLLELRTSRVGRVGLPVEEDLVVVEGAVLDYNKQSAPPDVSVETDFGVLDFPKSEKEMQENRNLKRQAQALEIQMGLTTVAEIIAEERDIPLEEAEQLVEEMKGVEVEIPDTLQPEE